jgi:hypothetical protein
LAFIDKVSIALTCGAVCLKKNSAETSGTELPKSSMTATYDRIAINEKMPNYSAKSNDEGMRYWLDNDVL